MGLALNFLPFEVPLLGTVVFGAGLAALGYALWMPATEEMPSMRSAAAA